jgi:hypothetical protein
MKFAISSHKDYFSLTEQKIVESLLNSGINPDNIYLFIGGYDGEYQKLDGVHHRYACPHNSMDFTGLISVVELNIESDYWFLLHDTCFVGDRFYNLIKEYPHSNKNHVCLTNGLSMNMGSYRWDYLMGIKERLFRYKNTSTDLQKFKTLLVMEEDALFHPKEHCYDVFQRQTTGPMDYYNNGTHRIIEYFPGIDVHKIKANWFLKDIYVNKP